MKTITTFGEIMLRMTPQNIGDRITHSSDFKVTVGGSACNVAVAISNLGMESRFITRLPENKLKERVQQFLKKEGVNGDHISYGGSRIGTYWTEIGSGPRSSYVIYDREHSSFAQSSYDDYNWNEIFKNTGWFHFTGISPAVSSNVYSILKRLVPEIKVPYSVDLNYRKMLWNWCNHDKNIISKTMTELCQSAKLIAGNETDFTEIFGFKNDNVKPEIKFYSIAKMAFQKFPKMKYLAISNRVSHSATLNDWNGFFYVKNEDVISSYESKPFRIDTILDRIGTGDSFVAGIIYGIHIFGPDKGEKILDFATTLSALNHTTFGDASNFDFIDVMNTMISGGSGRILR